MKIGIPREASPGERRVAATPDTVAKLIKLGFEVQIERGAGTLANYTDAAFEAAGAAMVERTDIWSNSDLLLKIEPPTDAEAGEIREGAHLICFLWPSANEGLINRLAERDVTCFAMDKIPRISRAQKMDALSSMSNVSGYRAVIEAAHHFGSFFTGQITAAGKVPPAKVLIVGAGVAGLAALGAARSLGAIVRAFDVRPTVKDQVRSLGGEFLEVEMEESGDGGGGYAKTMSEEYHTAQMALFLEQAKEVDIVITTALIPGRTAPILWEKRAVEAMKPGSVVVDLAAIQGGNCEVTESGRTIKHNGVTVIGETDLTSRLPTVCSQLYGQNLVHLLTDMCASGEYTVDLEDEVVRGSIVLQEGERLPPPPKPEPSPPPKVEAEPEPAAAPVAAAAATPAEETSSEGGFGLSGLIGVALIGVWCWLRFTDMSMGPETNEFLQHLTVFALAVFVGWQVVWSVSAALHTPLMSVTNAISGIIIVGGLLQANQGAGVLALYLGVAAVFFATINISGGFLVTKRMLKMFRK